MSKRISGKGKRALCILLFGIGMWLGAGTMRCGGNATTDEDTEAVMQTEKESSQEDGRAGRTDEAGERNMTAENISETEEDTGLEIDVLESEPNVSDAADEMSAYYGCYRITKFYFTQYYAASKYDCLPDQEVDLLLNQIVVLEPDRLVTCDTERRLGRRGGRSKAGAAGIGRAGKRGTADGGLWGISGDRFFADEILSGTGFCRMQNTAGRGSGTDAGAVYYPVGGAVCHL